MLRLIVEWSYIHRFKCQIHPDFDSWFVGTEHVFMGFIKEKNVFNVGFFPHSNSKLPRREITETMFRGTFNPTLALNYNRSFNNHVVLSLHYLQGMAEKFWALLRSLPGLNTTLNIPTSCIFLRASKWQWQIDKIGYGAVIKLLILKGSNRY